MISTENLTRSHRFNRETTTNNVYSQMDYTYNAIGNILKKEVVGSTRLDYTYDPVKKHAVTSIQINGGSSYNFIYDLNGNMISGYDLTNLQNIAARTITYNADNMPTAVNRAGAVTTISYDGTSNRVKKVSPSGTTYYIGEHYEVINNDPTKYIFAGNLRIAKISSATGTFYFHKDHLGSSAAMTNDTGSVQETSNYMPFGEMREHTGLTLSNYKFTDQEFDPETGLYYYGARYYDPTIGRFISADSVVPDPYDPQTLNRYTYCRNNPIIYTDPTGHFFIIDDILIGAAIGAIIGGSTSAIMGGNVWQGMLLGAVSGAVFAGVGGFVNNSIAFAAVPGGIGPPTAGWAAAGSIGGGIAGGAAAGATAAGLSGGNIGQGALYGGITGGAFGALGSYYGNSWGVGRVAAQTLAGGGIGELSGIGFEKGAWFAFGASSARYLYNAAVNYDATWESGGDAVEKRRYEYPVNGANNVGTQGEPLNPDGWFNEGGRVSRFANSIPGINATAGLHDVFQVSLDQGLGSFARNVLNVPGMLPAAALTYSGLMTDSRAFMIYSNGLRVNRGR